MSPRQRVLVVDDFTDAREMYREYLASVGFEVIEATNGEEAVERAIDCTPDVILMDLALPVMDGLEATRRIKADERTADIPVVAMSGFDLAVVPGDANLAGAVAFVAKPCFPHEVVQAIRQALSMRVNTHQ
jgi:two-component system cell cycle response regulator DivK